MSRGLSAEETIIPAWFMAIRNRPVTQKLIFHSDRGTQYACNEFVKILKANKLITQSMSRSLKTKCKPSFQSLNGLKAGITVAEDILHWATGQ